MEPTGIIFAALDCDADAIEDWNRWYDLEHTPPNVLLDGIMSSNRYVAPPELHRGRTCADGSPFAAGRATFLTIYTLTGDPATAFGGMSGLREELIAAGRMAFPDDKKAVREGDVFESVSAVASAPTRLVPGDVPFVGHTGIVIRQHRRSAASSSSSSAAAGLVGRPGVHGVWSLESRNRPGIHLDIVYVEGDTAEVARSLAAGAGDEEVLVVAPFDRIEPLRYPWAEAIRASDLPPTVGP